MADSYDGEDLAVRLEVLPRAGWAPADHEAEAERAGVPGLVGEGGLLVLRVEGADSGEGDRVVAEEHGGVVAEKRGRDVANREDGHADHGARFDADVGLHIGRTAGDESKGNEWAEREAMDLCFSSVGSNRDRAAGWKESVWAQE